MLCFPLLYCGAFLTRCCHSYNALLCHRACHCHVAPPLSYCIASTLLHCHCQFTLPFSCCFATVRCADFVLCSAFVILHSHSPNTLFSLCCVVTVMWLFLCHAVVHLSGCVATLCSHSRNNLFCRLACCSHVGVPLSYYFSSAMLHRYGYGSLPLQWVLNYPKAGCH